MKNLEPQAKTGCFQVQLAQATAAVHFITNEQILAIESADDLLQITGH